MRRFSGVTGVDRSGPQRRISFRAGFTIVELIVVTAVIAVLAALLLPAVQQARGAARRVQCRNNLRNVGLALIQDMESFDRFTASGYYGRNPTTGDGQHQFNWVVQVLPYLEQGPLAAKWNKDLPLDDPGNQALTAIHIPVLTCPDDITTSRQGDLSYVVSGGIGFTVKYGNGVRDCPVDPSSGQALDLNRDGIACPPTASSDASPSDREWFARFGVFFLETWKWDVSTRHHNPASIQDGMSNTFLATENVRVGYNPAKPNDGGWAAVLAYQQSFFIGNPCQNSNCSTGPIKYSLSNAGSNAINSGLMSPEGSSAVPNSFHPGGVHMAFCDGRVVFLSQNIDGAVYAALASPQGQQMLGTPFEQPIPSEY